MKVKDNERSLKADTFNKLYDEFIKLKIGRFYLKVKIFFVEQDIDREAIKNIFENVMTAKCKHLDKENDKHDKNLVKTNKKMIQVMGHSKYFSKNKEFTYETIVETKFMDPSF